MLIISKGKLVAFDAPENLEKLLMGVGSISFMTEASKEDAQSILETIAGISEWDCEEKENAASVQVKMDDGFEARDICRKLFFPLHQRKKRSSS